MKWLYHSLPKGSWRTDSEPELIQPSQEIPRSRITEENSSQPLPVLLHEIDTRQFISTVAKYVVATNFSLLHHSCGSSCIA